MLGSAIRTMVQLPPQGRCPADGDGVEQAPLIERQDMGHPQHLALVPDDIRDAIGGPRMSGPFRHGSRGQQPQRISTGRK